MMRAVCADVLTCGKCMLMWKNKNRIPNVATIVGGYCSLPPKVNFLKADFYHKGICFFIFSNYPK